MNTAEIKVEIQKALDDAPKDVLQSVLEYLKKARQTNKENLETIQYLRKILDEDRELLEKLA